MWLIKNRRVNCGNMFGFKLPRKSPLTIFPQQHVMIFCITASHIGYSAPMFVAPSVTFVVFISFRHMNFACFNFDWWLNGLISSLVGWFHPPVWQGFSNPWWIHHSHKGYKRQTFDLLVGFFWSMWFFLSVFFGFRLSSQLTWSHIFQRWLAINHQPVDHRWMG